MLYAALSIYVALRMSIVLLKLKLARDIVFSDGKDKGSEGGCSGSEGREGPPPNPDRGAASGVRTESRASSLGEGKSEKGEAGLGIYGLLCRLQARRINPIDPRNGELALGSRCQQP
jgi:hypothetical protein